MNALRARVQLASARVDAGLGVLERRRRYWLARLRTAPPWLVLGGGFAGGALLGRLVGAVRRRPARSVAGAPRSLWWLPLLHAGARRWAARLLAASTVPAAPTAPTAPTDRGG